MTSPYEIRSIFEKITERSSDQIFRIGARCESDVYYRVEDLTEEELNVCAEYVVERINNVIYPSKLDIILKLPGGYTFFAERLSAIYSERFPAAGEIPIEQYLDSKSSNGSGERWRGKNAILVTDVITTARSSLEAHTKATLKGINVLCWATLIDRTFGPGPVSVVSALTGEPVRMLANIV
jgi:hypothetical protein